VIRRALALCVILAGCRSERAPAPGLAQDSTEGAAPSAATPTSFSELAPGDTASVILVMRRTMQDIDGALAGFTRRDTTLDAEPGQEPRKLSVWLEDDVPRKLTVTEPNEAGRMLNESSFWFVQGEVRVVLQPLAAYAFDADRILVWTDETLVPITDVTTEERMRREREVVDQAHRWLEVFGIKLM
jgi:hypothetical protein